MEMINAVGRRKAAVARVFVKKSEGNSEVTINGRALAEYFPIKDIAQKVMDPLNVIKDMDGTASFNINAILDGGGLKGQAEALRMAISRALCKVNIDFRKPLKERHFLTRDSREVERKKFGKRKARRTSQFSKR
ncbi:MAG TPA: 30S ribosomal protein S9 [Saprospiraceae bacterium]|nr:30S ribosomal protein S9 [Saprospiraceae bacterium]